MHYLQKNGQTENAAAGANGQKNGENAQQANRTSANVQNTSQTADKNEQSTDTKSQSVRSDVLRRDTGLSQQTLDAQKTSCSPNRADRLDSSDTHLKTTVALVHVRDDKKANESEQNSFNAVDSSPESVSDCPPIPIRRNSYRKIGLIAPLQRLDEEIESDASPQSSLLTEKIVANATVEYANGANPLAVKFSEVSNQRISRVAPLNKSPDNETQARDVQNSSCRVNSNAERTPRTQSPLKHEEFLESSAQSELEDMGHVRPLPIFDSNQIQLNTPYRSCQKAFSTSPEIPTTQAKAIKVTVPDALLQGFRQIYIQSTPKVTSEITESCPFVALRGMDQNDSKLSESFEKYVPNICTSNDDQQIVRPADTLSDGTRKNW